MVVLALCAQHRALLSNFWRSTIFFLTPTLKTITTITMTTCKIYRNIAKKYFRLFFQCLRAKFWEKLSGIILPKIVWKIAGKAVSEGLNSRTFILFVDQPWWVIEVWVLCKLLSGANLDWSHRHKLIWSWWLAACKKLLSTLISLPDNVYVFKIMETWIREIC